MFYNLFVATIFGALVPTFGTIGWTGLKCVTDVSFDSVSIKIGIGSLPYETVGSARSHSGEILSYEKLFDSYGRDDRQDASSNHLASILYYIFIIVPAFFQTVSMGDFLKWFCVTNHLIRPVNWP